MKMYVIQYAAGGLVGPFLSLQDATEHQLSTDEGHIHELEPANVVEQPFDMTLRQALALVALATRYHVPIYLPDFRSGFGMPGYVVGQVGPIYVGVSPEGDISS